MSDALQANDNALSLALGIIHHKTLEGKWVANLSGENNLKGSYKEALTSKARTFATAKPDHSVQRNIGIGKCGKTVFVSGIGENIQAKELWRFCKGKGRVKDIVLPKKRDKNNRRFGFLVMESANDAMNLIKSAHGSRLGDNILSFKPAREGDKKGIDRNGSKTSSNVGQPQ